MKRKFVAGVTVGLLLMTSTVLADVADGDFVGPDPTSTDIEAGASFSRTVELYVVRQSTNNIVRSVQWTVATSGACDGITAGAAAPGEFTLPESWGAIGQSGFGTRSRDLDPPVFSTATISGTAGAAGNACTITYTGTPTSTFSGNGIPPGQRTVEFTLEFVAPANTAPEVALVDGPTEVDESGTDEHTYTFEITDPDQGDAWSFVTGYPDCGDDGSLVDGSAGIDDATQTGSFSCVFDDGPATSTVAVQVQDAVGEASNEATRSVAVANVAPTGTFTATSPVADGDQSTLSFSSVTDPSQADTTSGFRYAFACDGDTDGLPTTYAAAGGDASAPCSFPSPGSYSVAGRVFDKDNGHSTETATVQVDNNPPVVTAPADQTADEGSATSFDLGSFTDPGSGTSWTVTVDWGDGSATESFTIGAAGALGTRAHTYDDGPATHTVTVRVTDEWDDFDQATFEVAVANVAPTATFAATSPIDEGSSSTLSLTDVVDPSQADTAAGFRYSFACDGDTDSLASTYADAGASSTTSCLFPQDGTFTVLGRVFDEDDGHTTYQQDVMVLNVAPEVTAPDDQSTDEGSATSFDLGSFTDPGDDAPWTVTVDWGDGSATESFTIGAAGALGTRAHTYDDGPATHTVTVTVDDGTDTGSATFEVAVANVAPTATFAATSPIDEGSSSTLSLTDVVDPSQADTAAGFRYSFACDGDTDSLASTYADAGASSTTSCLFPQDGTFTVLGRVFDKDDGHTTYGATVVVENVAPEVTAPADQSTDEGSATAFDLGSFTDPGDDAPWTVTVDWGDGSPSTTFQVGEMGALGTRTHTYDDGPATRTVTVTVDDGTDTGSATFEVTVANVPPTITTFSGPSAGLTGQNLTFTGQATDPSQADTKAGLAWRFAVGAPPTGAYGAPHANTFTTQFETCGVHTVWAQARDKDGGESEPVGFEVALYDGQFLSPLKAGSRNLVQSGRVLPVKVDFGCDGFIGGLQPAITLLQGSFVDDPSIDESTNAVPTESVSAADTTGLMRQVNDHYLYNLSIPKDAQAGSKYTVSVRPHGPGTLPVMRVVLEIRR